MKIAVVSDLHRARDGTVTAQRVREHRSGAHRDSIVRRRRERGIAELVRLTEAYGGYDKELG